MMKEEVNVLPAFGFTWETVLPTPSVKPEVAFPAVEPKLPTAPVAVFESPDTAPLISPLVALLTVEPTPFVVDDTVSPRPCPTPETLSPSPFPRPPTTGRPPVTPDTVEPTVYKTKRISISGKA